MLMALMVVGALGALILFAGIGIIYFSGQKPEPKYVMIHFDDGFMSQYDFAAPILDRYGLRGSFWIVCNYASGSSSSYMNWNHIDDLVSRGHDIQNHGMSHTRLLALSDEELVTEIGGCKEKLMQHGSSGDAFAIPFNDGHNDERIVTVISQFHNYAKGAGGAPQPANCGISGCEITTSDGVFNENSRYAMRQWSHDNFARDKTEQQIMEGFINAVNLGHVDSNGDIVQISIITYHRINEPAGGPSLDLFEAEMKYLAENGFTTLVMDDIVYDEPAGKFKLK